MAKSLNMPRGRCFIRQGTCDDDAMIRGEKDTVHIVESRVQGLFSDFLDSTGYRRCGMIGHFDVFFRFYKLYSKQSCDT